MDSKKSKAKNMIEQMGKMKGAKKLAAKKIKGALMMKGAKAVAKKAKGK